MADDSHLDGKYFIDPSVYNCPFCKRRNVVYVIDDCGVFDWSDSKKAYHFRAQCKSCSKHSFHLSFEQLTKYLRAEKINAHESRPIFGVNLSQEQLSKKDIDSRIFYSVPSSFFALDGRIHSSLRDLILEAEGCLKMNYLTGASACVRKCIYQLLKLEKASGKDYKGKIKSLKKKFSEVDKSYFDVLSSIQSGTSDIVHENSWESWDAGHLRLFLETLKSVLKEMYVTPDERKQRVAKVTDLLARAKKKDKSKSADIEVSKIENA